MDKRAKTILGAIACLILCGCSASFVKGLDPLEGGGAFRDLMGTCHMRAGDGRVMFDVDGLYCDRHAETIRQRRAAELSAFEESAANPRQ